MPEEKRLVQTLVETKKLNENGPNLSLYFGTKNMIRVILMAAVMFWYGFDSKSKLVYAGEIQK